MSYEEDYLSIKVRELERRIAELEASCPGINSSASIGSQRTNKRQSRTNPQPRARTTASPSKQASAGNYTVDLTDGNTPETT